HGVEYRAHGPVVLHARADVPGVRDLAASGQELIPNYEVRTQAIEHMLPRSRRRGRADLERLAVLRRAREIGNEPILGPIAAADDITRAHGCNQGTVWSCKEGA